MIKLIKFSRLLKDYVNLLIKVSNYSSKEKINKRICNKSLNKKLLIFSLFILYNKNMYNYLILFNISISDLKSLQKSENYKKNI